MANSRVRSYMTQGLLAVAVAIAHSWLVPASHAQRVAAVAPDRARELRPVTIHVEHAPLVEVLRAIAQQAGLMPAFDDAMIPSGVRITLHLRDVPAIDAFEQVLRGTGLTANVHAKGNVAIVRAADGSVASGTIQGHVNDAGTKRPLRGAKVGLDGIEQATETADDGSFRLTGVHAGVHTVHIRSLGYARSTRSVTVVDNTTADVEVALEPAASPLAQVVVTGTVIQTERKAVPNAMTVITAKDIEQRGITKIDQLFRGDVPGVFALTSGSNAPTDQVTMFSRGATALPTGASAGILGIGNTNPIKTYVDGVELADPKYLSQIDPRSIERIEILTGPQASTIYGSNAINGVMQIFTKRGTSNTPQLTLNLLSGWVENNFSNAITPQHDYSAQISGIEGHVSYNAGGAWNYIGPWNPGKQTARWGGYGGTRFNWPTGMGRVTADMTLRYTTTLNRVYGNSQQSLTDYRGNGWFTVASTNGRTAASTNPVIGQTLGIVMGYAPTPWWSHEFGAGQDVSGFELRYTIPGYTSRADTLLRFQQSHTDRRSLHYTTTARGAVTRFTQATITVGADGWRNLTSSLLAQPQTLTGTLANVSSLTRQPNHNSGAFLQMQLGILDRLFFTYGLRAEWNPAFGKDAEPNYAPRYGVAYTHELGTLTAKLRGSYGRSTRPPQSGLTVATPVSDPYYGNFDRILANPELHPESQRGGEGGLELYWGTRGSLMITRYNQTVNSLIDLPKADSVRSLLPNPPFGFYNSLDTDNYGYAYQFQYLNVGNIRNQGWELQGSVNTGPFTTKGTYSWTKSRVLGVNPKYRDWFSPQQYPEYQPGTSFTYLPEHTWATGITYAVARTTIEFDLTGRGQMVNSESDFTLQHLSFNIRLPQNRLNVSAPSTIAFSPGYMVGDVTASYRISPYVTGLFQVQNLTDRYTNDFNATYAAIGRHAKAGVRLQAF